MASSNPGFSGGLQSPLQAAQNGGFKTLSGDEYLIQLVRTLAADCDSDNPFQDVGIGREAVFQNVGSPAWRAFVRKQMEDLFKTHFERANLAKLDSISFDLAPVDGAEGDVVMKVAFLSIETQERLNVDVSIRRL